MSEHAYEAFASYPPVAIPGEQPVGPASMPGPAPLVGGNGNGWPHPVDLERAAVSLPPLHMPPGMTVVRDRWERLVTTLDIAHPPAEVWRALTDPERLKHWLAVCHGSIESTSRECTLDFEDGEFFLCRPVRVEPLTELRYLWRWLGIGQATVVSWQLQPLPAHPFAGANGQSGTRVTVVEEAVNPPWDWQTWNGGGWPGILNQLAAHLRTGTSWRWPWRRMGPYAQIELPLSLYEAWDQLFTANGLKYWLLAMRGGLAPGATLPVMMGDASGMVEMHVREVVQPGEMPPSFLPYVTFALKRTAWNCEVPGRIWLEPAGWGRCLMQVFHANWENLPAPLQLSERKLVSNFWAGAVQRAAMFCGRPGGNGHTATAPHTWGAGAQLAPPAAPDARALPPAFMPPAMMQAGEFLGKVMGDMSGALVGMMCWLGDRLGLFKDLAANGDATAEEFAARAGIHVRYAREWLLALRSAGYLDYDRQSQRFSLGAHRSMVLADEGGPMFMGGGFQQLAGLFAPLDQLAAAFRSGEGVPQHAYPSDLRDGMERMSAGWFNNLLVPMWIGAAPAIRERLERGVRVADIGCGAGRAILQLAQAFPSSAFVGYDAFGPAIERAQDNALGKALSYRVRFVQHDVTTGLPEPFDVVMMFDSLHDMSDPIATLSAVRRALTPGGVLLLMEIRSADRLEDNVGNPATMLFATGLLYNTPVAMANSGNDLGLMGFGERSIRDLCGRAGFGTVHRLPIDNPINILYEVKP